MKLGKFFASFLIVALIISALPVQFSVGAATSELFFSEYIEGSSNNKALEIYNGTGAAVDLAAGDYVVEIYFNGSTSVGNTVDLVGIIADGDVFVVADDGAVGAILTVTDQTDTGNFFNGDDVVLLKKAGVVIDSFGQLGVDPGSQWAGGGQDDTLRRKADVCVGDTNPDDAFDASVEWDSFAQDTFTGLGSHTSNCGGGGPIGQPFPLTEDFDDCTLAGWEIISVDADASHTWSCNATYSNIDANGYGDTAPANEWLITPALNMNAQENDTLTFRNYTNYSDINYPQLHVLYSTDYDGGGDPTSATWTELTGINFSPENSGAWVDSGPIDLSGINGTNVYFAFQYVSSGTGGGSAANWRLDSINFFEKVPAIPLPLSEGFDDCTLTNWEIVSVDADASHTWSCNSYYSNIDVNGYGDSDPANEWLITPPLNLDAQEHDTLTFRNYTNYTDVNYPQLHVLYSTDYDGGGDPTSATWTELTGINFSPEGSGSWVDAGPIDLSGISGTNVYFAFQYVSSGTGGGTAANWRLDAIEFFEKIPIGKVQGNVGDSDSGTSHSSPYVGQTVVIQGVIYEKTQQYNSYGGAYYGFFIQNTSATADSDPNSSDGIFVYMSYHDDLIGGYVPQVEDEIIMRGRVSEYYNLTELSSASALQVVRSGVDLDAEIPAFDVNPPSSITDDTTYDDIQDAYRYWERREGMRGQIPAGSIVLNGRDVFAGTFDSEVWVARPDSLIAQRTDQYKRRSFRDIHPLDDIPTASFDNDNPYRILMGTFGVKEWANDTTALLAPARTFDIMTSAATGGVYYNYGKYSIQVDEQIQLSDGVDPSLNNPPVAPEREFEYSVVDFNVENLYDYVDDPFDGCDFQGNAGCPGVYPPFDYAPSSDAVYQTRLTEIAQQIITNLHSPDVILAQEAEDQDICTVTAGVYACGTTNNADGKPDTLQELATVIASLGGPNYDAAYDRDGADDRGIVSGYLFRTDRVELLPAMADDPVLGSSPSVIYDKPGAVPLPFNTDVQNPKVLNATLPDSMTGDTDGDNVFTRAPQVALFRIWRDGVGLSAFQDVYISNNHFSSGPDGRVGQRTEQAAYNAAIVEALQAVNPKVYVSVGGDLNVYPRPDDPFPTPNESDQLAALYEVPMTNLWDIMVSQDPASAYSYVYVGQAQTLDQLFVSLKWLSELKQARMTHINADFPADYDGDGPRGTSDHDPVFSAYNLLPTLKRLTDLVKYYDANGMITGNNTTDILLDRLAKARRLLKKGKYDAYMSQLQAFIDQTYDFTPQFIPQEVADALATEVALLMSLP